MARALFGHVGTPTEQALSFEISRLRRRVAELETEVADLRAAQARAARALDDPALELELHRLTGADQPALT